MKRFLPVALPAVLAAFALTSCAGSVKSTAVATPALWKVADADTTVYLFGTIHVLPKGMVWTSPELTAAVNASQGLVLETVLPKDPAALGATMASLGMSPGLPPLLERVPADKRAALKAVIDKSKIPMAVLDKLETWAAALALTAQETQAAGLTSDEGAEAQLTTRFEKAHKPITGLETPEQQLGYFDTLPEPAQRRFLASVGDDDAKAQAQLDAMIAAWRTGDVRKIASSFDDELKDSPELTEALMTRRNANWANWVAARLAKPGTVFVAVGAGHLAGDMSVEAQLAKRGLTVTRVQ